MKILHTGDWHLGKTLEGLSRIEEQEEFLEDFIRIVRENDIDLVIIAGDVYDSFNPSAKAEKLFYDTLKRLSENGKTLTLVIAGNHDSPDRLVAAGPLAKDHGIMMMGTPKSTIEVGEYGRHKVVDSGEGFIEIEINGEKAVIMAIPFPSEKRLNEVIYQGMDTDIDKLASYEDRMAQLFKQLSMYYRNDTINLMVSHLFITGSEESGSERSIQLGGSYLINSDLLPKEAQYIALGHVHKPQIVGGTLKKARYAGSPIHYSKREIGFTKSLWKVELKVGEAAIIDQIPLRTYKPIEIWSCESIDEAIQKCTDDANRACWVYLEIKTDRYIKENEIKELKDLKKDIISIRPITPEELQREKEIKTLREKSFEEIFREFYLKERGTEVAQETLEAIMKIVIGEETDEADSFKN
jgi:DNA repair protein SbcD/Mre11